MLSEDEKSSIQQDFNLQQDLYMRESRRQVTISDFKLSKGQ